MRAGGGLSIVGASVERDRKGDLDGFKEREMWSLRLRLLGRGEG